MSSSPERSAAIIAAFANEHHHTEDGAAADQLRADEDPELAAALTLLSSP